MIVQALVQHLRLGLDPVAIFRAQRGVERGDPLLDAGPLRLAQDILLVTQILLRVPQEEAAVLDVTRGEEHGAERYAKQGAWKTERGGGVLEF